MHQLQDDACLGTMLARLQAAARGGRLENADYDYWALRFGDMHIRFWCGITFEHYLECPLEWEARARASATAPRGLGLSEVLFYLPLRTPGREQRYMRARLSLS